MGEAVGQRSGHLNDYDRFRVVQLLECALSPAFVGTLPGAWVGSQRRCGSQLIGHFVRQRA